jgi:hypothetical protein
MEKLSYAHEEALRFVSNKKSVASLSYHDGLYWLVLVEIIISGLLVSYYPIGELIRNSNQMYIELPCRPKLSSN